MLQQTLDHVCFLFVHLYPLKIIQVFLETKKELLKLTSKNSFFVLLVLKTFSGRFIDRHVHNTFISIKADSRLDDTAAKSARSGLLETDFVRMARGY